MTNRGWSAGAGDLDRALAAFDAAAAGPEALLLAEAAGRLAAMDAGAKVAAWAAGHPAQARAAAEAVAGVDLGELEDAAVGLRALLDGEGVDLAADELGRAMEEAFRARDRVELRSLGLTALLGQAPPRAPAGDPAPESAELVFESLIRPELWRLTAANEARRAALAWMAPQHRPAFWWWHEGADVAPHAVPSLPAVAHLVARFPGAAAALRALVSAQEAWDEAGSARRSAAVVSLGAWVKRRSELARGTTPHALPLAAAAAAEEITLVDRPDVQVSWSPPDGLVVDLVADRAPGALPSLRLAGGAIVLSEPVPGAEERFRIAAGASLLAEARVTLVLPLAAGTVEIPLPPRP